MSGLVPDSLPKGSIRLKRSIFYWGSLIPLLDRNHVRSLSFVDHAIILNRGSGDNELRLYDVGEITSHSRLLWTDIEIVAAERVVKICGLPKRSAEAIHSLIKSAQINFILGLFEDHSRELESLFSRLKDCADPSRYLSNYRHSSLLKDSQIISSRIPELIPAELSFHEFYWRLNSVRVFIKNEHAIRICGNEKYIEQELIRSKSFFDNFEKNPLTDEQRLAVVTDENRNLVVAAAGSGKTSVITAKAAWLIQKGYVKPSELLVLAYAKKASEELGSRLTSRLGQSETEQISIHTFHALGTKIIRDVDNKYPSLSKKAEDKKALQDLLKSFVHDLFIDSTLRPLIESWFQSYFAPYRSEMEFNNYGEYWRYIKTHEIRSLNGDLVKSYEECEIANFLYLQGIKYAYEKPYEKDTSTSSRRQYKPDFYLIDYGIYIEHFAISLDGRTPPFINQDEYLESMEWKRKLHKRNRTILVETYSYEKKLGKDTLTKRLMEKLRIFDVKAEPIPPEEIFKKLSEQERVDRFTQLIQTFLNHYKGSQLSEKELVAKAKKTTQSDRSLAFVQIFLVIYNLYETHLKNSQEIDFEDMIRTATNYVLNGQFKSPFDYIIIDEFQDISSGRARLIQALLNQRPQTQLLAVGDDWQSIYRFAGSDTSIMRDFSFIFNPCKRIDLTTTFRCVDKIANVSAQFVMQNPSQLRKQFRSVNFSKESCILVGFPADNNHDLLSETLASIESEVSNSQSKPKVLILGRYNFIRPSNLRQIARRYSSLNIEFQTVHKSKGSEADYVIILELKAGKHGFPSEIEDDPLLDLVLSAPEKHPNAEERRLFYVALTRAKRKVFLLTERTRSAFVSELITSNYDVVTFGHQLNQDNQCPICIEGQMGLKSGPTGTFYGCSNFPYCNHTQSVCPSCNIGLFRKIDETFVCQECGHELEICPRCKKGQIRKKHGKNGLFFGCSNWPDCNYTRNIH